MTGRKEEGFSLLELAVALFISGLMLVGAVQLFGKLWEERRRQNTQVYLQEARMAVLEYAQGRGRMPVPDAASGGYQFGDGLSESSFSPATLGWLPHVSLKLKSRDLYGSQLVYCVNGGLLSATLSNNCAVLKAYIKGTVGSWYPQSWRAGMPAGESIPVAAILLSPGKVLQPLPPEDVRASTPIEAFELIGAVDNRALCGPGAVYADAPEQPDSFDDMAASISLVELYEALRCGQ